ncbi:hypothetical protein NPIL_454861, partial [Nephila pilipes]
VERRTRCDSKKESNDSRFCCVRAVQHSTESEEERSQPSGNNGTKTPRDVRQTKLPLFKGDGC